MSFTKPHARPTVRQMLPPGKLEALPHSSLSNRMSILPHLQSCDSQAPAGPAPQLQQAAWGHVEASWGHSQGWRSPTALNKDPVLWNRYVVQSEAEKWDLQFYLLTHLRTHGNVQSCFKGLFLPCTDAYRKGKRHIFATSATSHWARLKPLTWISSARAGQIRGHQSFYHRGK